MTAPADSHARLTLASSLLFAAVEGSNRLFGLYRVAPWVDLPSHLVSGVMVTSAVLWFFARRGERVGWVRATGLNLAVALAWEVVEYVDEMITPDPPHLEDTLFWDGVGDVVAAILGGWCLLAGLALRRRRLRGRRR